MIDVINPLFTRFPELEPCRAAIFSTVDALEKCFRSGGKLLLCGNGGSCSDAQHIVGELMKGFLSTRPLSGAAKDNMRANCPGIDERLLGLLQKHGGFHYSRSVRYVPADCRASPDVYRYD